MIVKFKKPDTYSRPSVEDLVKLKSFFAAPRKALANDYRAMRKQNPKLARFFWKKAKEATKTIEQDFWS